MAKIKVSALLLVCHDVMAQANQMLPLHCKSIVASRASQQVPFEREKVTLCHVVMVPACQN